MLFLALLIPDPTLSTFANSTLSSIIAYIQFNGLDSCSDASTMPDEITYTLRVQEYELTLIFVLLFSFRYEFLIFLEMVCIIFVLSL